MTSNSRRVVITGLGLVSPLGNSAAELWQGLSRGTSGVDRITQFDADNLPSPFGAECRSFTGDIGDFGPLEKTMQRNIKKNLKVMCREIEMGVAAAQLALNDAELAPGSCDPDRTGVVYGCDYILTMPEEFAGAVRKCMDDQGRFHFDRWADAGLPEVTPLWLLKYLPNMPASHIAIYNDFRGPNNSITMREAAANLAIGEAYCTILRDSADRIVAGATGTRIHPMRSVHVMLQEQIATGDNPTKLSRPFDRERSGMVVGEGAGAIVLEELQAAKNRGATILGEVVGHASSTVMDRQGVGCLATAIANVLRLAMKSAGLEPDDVGHVHAHGLGTLRCDAEEAKAIHDVFASRSKPIPVVAAKSNFGNLGAAGGMVELIGSVLAFGDGSLFPTLNYETPDPDCPVHVVTDRNTPTGDTFINISVTPVGQASATVVRRWADE